MQKLNWNRISYVAAVILLLAGAVLKIMKQPRWEILFILSAAALAGNLLIEQFGKGRRI